VCSMIHESPFYGLRKPAAQKGSKLLRVSDLFILGYVSRGSRARACSPLGV